MNKVDILYAVLIALCLGIFYRYYINLEVKNTPEIEIVEVQDTCNYCDVMVGDVLKNYYKHSIDAKVHMLYCQGTVGIVSYNDKRRVFNIVKCELAKKYIK